MLTHSVVHPVSRSNCTTDRTSAPVVAGLFFVGVTDLRLIELSAAKLPGTVEWVVGKMGDAAPPEPAAGCLTVHFLIPDGYAPQLS
jgi:hypothetical protein